MSTGLAYILFFAVMASAGPINLSLMTLLIPPSALLRGWVVLGEAVTPAAAVGMVVIGVGLVVIDGRVFLGDIDVPLLTLRDSWVASSLRFSQ